MLFYVIPMWLTSVARQITWSRRSIINFIYKKDNLEKQLKEYSSFLNFLVMRSTVNVRRLAPRELANAFDSRRGAIAKQILLLRKF